MTDLTSPISSEEFMAAKELVRTVLRERNPDLDVSEGSAIMGLVVENTAQLTAVHAANYDALSKAFSLKAITENLIDVDDDLVDSLVSNYFITRRQASPASGPARVVTSLNVRFTLSQDFVFEAEGETFRIPRTVQVLRAGSQASQTPTTRVLVPRADGRWEFTVEVIADNPGTAGMLPAGATLSPRLPIDGVMSASAATDFSGGADRETNAGLLARAQEGVTAKTLAGPEHIQAALSQIFPGLTSAVVGIGSPLMTRDRGNLFGISQGSTEDIWVKTTSFPGIREVSVMVRTPDGGSPASFVLRGDDAAGVYRVRFIRRGDVAGLQGDTPLTVIPVKHSDVFDPKTPRARDLRFSGIADLHVSFHDTSGIQRSAVEYPYIVEVFTTPSVGAVGNYVYDPSVRPAGTDYLVRAGVPCMVGVELSVGVRRGDVTPDIDVIQETVAAAINALPFGTPRVSSYLIHAALSVTLGRSEVVSLAMRGTIYAPESDIHLPLSSAITLPNRPQDLTAPANTFFACSPASVGVSIVS